MLGIAFSIEFALVTGRVSKMLILTFVPILDPQCQLWAIAYKQYFELTVPALLTIS